MDLEKQKCSNLFTANCNKMMLETEELNRKELKEHPERFSYLYPNLNDPNFNIKIAEKKEFSDAKYDGTIHDIKKYADILSKAEFELSPHQAFVRNFMSFQTPYNSLLLYHALGTGKTCSAIGVTEEMRDYYRQMGISKSIIIVASPNVQDNFKLQLFDERKLKLVDGLWTIKGCIGNKLLKEINPTSMRGLTKEKIIYQIKSLINSSYSFMGYTQFSNEINKIAGDSNNSQSKIRNLQEEFDNRLIVIDEVHNIRISDDNENKNIAKNLMYLVTVAKNIRLLLLSATPMFNNYKEIIWILNLMNINDGRGVISIKDIFDKSGNFKKSTNGEESGKELFIRKATGYVSYVRGENPYTFPFRVYPNIFAPDNTFKSISEYPKYQLNCKIIPDDKKIIKTSLFLNKIGDYQQNGYNYVIDRLRKKKINTFKDIQTFGYTDLQIPLESLNIIYPFDGLEELIKDIKPCESLNEEEDSPGIAIKESLGEEEIEEIELEDILNSGTNESLNESIPIESLKEPIPQEVSIPIESLNESLPNESLNESIPQEVSVPIEVSLPKIKTSQLTETLNKNIINEETSCEEIDEQILELTEKLNRCKKKNKGGSGESSNKIYIDSKQLTGVNGLKRIMNFVDTISPLEKGSFEYKSQTKETYGNIFAPDKIGNYSFKIKSICESIYNSKTKHVSSGIILIYSSYIDAGIIPMALALEEMGFTRYGQKSKPLFKSPPTEVVDVRTMMPPSSKKDFIPAKYVMITGDTRISPNNDLDVKSLTTEDNIDGNKIKVVLISQAGSEGLDFKAIRQIHIMEPWYNMNRIEQITGRGVRNFSHKDLPFEQRNVEIFLHGTILENAEEEAVDLYVYRVAEIKAIQIGKITRLLKQTAVDCIINHDQTEFTFDNFKKIESNQHVKQILSTGLEITEFKVGDIPNSAHCDYMESCEFDCLPNTNIDDSKINFDTYNENFMLINSDKIIQKIKILMKIRYFYKKKDLLYYINSPKVYPIVQIYSALTQMINDHTEYLIDKYGRTGYLINIGDYYLFQPSELNYNNISIYDRSVPLDFKHNMIKIDIKPELNLEKKDIEFEMEDEKEKDIGIHIINEKNVNNESNGKKILESMRANYDVARSTITVNRGEENWYKYCGIVILKMKNEGVSLDVLQNFIIDHIIESLMYNEKIDLLNYLDINCKELSKDVFLTKIKKYFCDKIIHHNKLTAIVLFDGPSRKNNLKIYVLTNKQWNPAEPEDIRDLGSAINEKYKLITNFNEYVGFIGFEDKQKYMVFKIKETQKKRHTGSRCDQAGKKKTIDLINKLLGEEKYTKENTKTVVHQELCIMQEFILRNFDREKRNGKTWFLTTELAVINDF
jgi:superfamily II DNA or RNA helicase